MKSGFFGWFNRREREARERDLQRELQSHLDAETDEQRAAGASPDEAPYAARRTFGNVALAAEHTRDAWGWAALDRLAQDVRFALRTLRKNLGYTALAVVVLALGIGANTSIFTAVNAALLRPLPFDHSEQLVVLYHTPPQTTFKGFRIFSVSNANFLDWRAQQHVFQNIALYHFHGLNLTGGDRPDSLQGAEVTEDFFAVFRVQPLLGRTFAPEEMEIGKEREIVLNYATWQKYFGGDRAIVGRTVSFDHQPYTVIGVMPERFRFPGFAKFWVPAAWTPKQRALRSNHNANVVARLKPGVTLEQAQAEMDTISKRLEQQYPAENTGWGALVLPMHETMVEDLRTPLLILLGAVGFVLLIACSNVANLVLAKTISRRKEVAIRSALGATRGRVLQLVLVETVILALGGGALGLLLAHYGVQLIVAYLGDRLSKSIEVKLDPMVLLFAFGISVLCGVLAGLLPAFRFTRRDGDLQGALKEGGRTDAESGKLRARSALVAAEVAMCMLLLIGAGLLVRTLWALHDIDPGFNPHNVVTMGVPRAGKDSGEFLQRTLERVRALPGVEAAGATTNVPLSHSDESNWPIQIEGQPPLPVGQQPNTATDNVTPGFFAALGIRILRGRDITDADAAGRPLVVVISQAMADKFWPGQDALGKRLFTSFFDPDKPREVVGVVANTKERGLETTRPLVQMYVPAAQAPNPAEDLVIRAAAGASASDVVREAMGAVHELDRTQPVTQPQTLEEVIATSYADRRFNMLLLVAFAALALVLAAAGIYGVLSYNVRRRLREIGIRLALGARAGDVLRMVVVEGLRPTLLGIAIGIVAALGLGKILATLVFGVRPTDLGTFAAVAALLAAVSLVACVLPAYRATRVQPLSVLRDE